MEITPTTIARMTSSLEALGGSVRVRTSSRGWRSSCSHGNPHVVEATGKLHLGNIHDEGVVAERDGYTLTEIAFKEGERPSYRELCEAAGLPVNGFVASCDNSDEEVADITFFYHAQITPQRGTYSSGGLCVAETSRTNNGRWGGSIRRSYFLALEDDGSLRWGLHG